MFAVEKIPGCHGGGLGVGGWGGGWLLCKAGVSFNKCMLMSEAAAMRGKQGPCCYLLLCLCTAPNPRPANGITARDEWALG